jgi:putative SOS response-associated peptidase YedK
MCYNASFPSKKEIEKFLGPDVHNPRWNKEYNSVSGFAFPEIPILSSDRQNEIQTFHWGLIPIWCKDEAQANEMRKNTLNAKSETVFEKPSFRSSIGNKRCLIFVNGFYEWRDFNKKKYPYYIHLKNQETFAIGGIHESWVNNQTGEIIKTCSIITTEANPLMATIHNSKRRMPLIFEKERMFEWIRIEISKEEITSLMKPLDENLMVAHTISKLITSRSENPNVPGVKKEFLYEELSNIQNELFPN